MKKFDAIIIGSGQAGNPLAHNLSDKGWKVALIEKEYLGGSCVNYGCTPTKTMIASAKIAHYTKTASRLGVKIGNISIDFKKIVERKNEMVKQWRKGQEKQVEKRNNITLIYGTACFIGEKTITVNNEVLTSDKIFINTGTSPVIPQIEGIRNIPYLTNKNVMDLGELPDHLIIIGGSYIGLEFGQMFLRFGCEVTVIEYGERILRNEDEDISESLMETLKKEGIKFLLNSNTIKADIFHNDLIELTIQNKKDNSTSKLIGTHILFGAGRTPNTAELNLDAAGITSNNGYIEVDDFLRTNVDGIYALGDVKGGPAFTNISYNDFQIVYHNLFNEEKKSINNRIVPYALFTDPELGRVGLTESQAKNAGYNIKVGKLPMSRVARAIETDETEGMMKVVIDADTNQIIGAAILGSNGGEVVQTIMALMYAKADWKVLKDVVYIHPTLTEGLFGLFGSVK